MDNYIDGVVKNDENANLDLTEPLVKPITSESVQEALEILKKYKEGKSSLEHRIIENEQWYKLRHWEYMRNKYNANAKKGERLEPASAWLFNSIANKHADMMDNFPEPNVLPREESDEGDAKILSAVVPVIFERNNFKKTYSDAAWYKLKNGTSCYGVFWKNDLENGLGDVAIEKVDLLNLFWEAGITDIQDSRNLFFASLVDDDILKEMYPELEETGNSKTLEIAEYVYDDQVNTDNKSVVIDWYYKKQNGTKTVLHYVKFCGDTVLYATENDPKFAERGWYDHAKYPFVFDVLYPEESTPYGFGYIDMAKDTQTYIDKLNQCIAENVMRTSKARYIFKDNADIDVEDFSDLSKDLIPCSSGNLNDNFKLIEEKHLDGSALNFLSYKVDELKETSSNRDVNSGGSGGGVTAAAAISALQEAGNKISRDLLNLTFNAYTELCYLVIENIRQFYTVERTFRIVGASGQAQYVRYSNQNIMPQSLGMMTDGTESFRMPIFDIKVKPQKANPFSRMSQNELAKELYGMGVFLPENADQALILLEMMDFEGKDKLVDMLNKNKTLLMMWKQAQMENLQLNAILFQLTGGRMGRMVTPEELQQVQMIGGDIGGANVPQNTTSNPMAIGIDGAMENAQTPYAAKMMERAKVGVDDTGNVQK